MDYDKREGGTLQKKSAGPAATAGLAALVTIATLPACRGDDPVAPAAAAGDCLPDGRLRAELYGAVETTVDWHGTALECEGMRRPFDEGARLRFAGPAGDGERRLAFIIALPGLEPLATGREFPAKVTLIEEDAGRFFSNGENDSCWSDVTAQSPTGDVALIDGIVYCVAPLVEPGGPGSVTLGELRFSGQVDWRSAR